MPSTCAEHGFLSDPKWKFQDRETVPSPTRGHMNGPGDYEWLRRGRERANALH